MCRSVGVFLEFSVAVGAYLEIYEFICGSVRFGWFSISRTKN